MNLNIENIPSYVLDLLEKYGFSELSEEQQAEALQFVLFHGQKRINSDTFGQR